MILKRFVLIQINTSNHSNLMYSSMH